MSRHRGGAVTEKISTKHPHFFQQCRSFYIDALMGFSTKNAPVIFFNKNMWKIIYTKYLTQPLPDQNMSLQW